MGMIVLGRIVAPYGVRGWVKIHPFGDDPESWRRMSEWWLAADCEGGGWQRFEVQGLRAHGAGWVAKLVGVDDRGGAEHLDGWFFAAPRLALPDTQEDEFYWADLVGLAVRNEQGEFLGKVEALLETGAHQVLVVKEGETERLLPFVSQVVTNVDVAGACIHVQWGKDW
jgi:16S rRNA processing protein RimM